MLGTFVTGLLAGLAVAVPIGAVAVLLFDVAHRRGLRRAAAGGLGIASADGVFAALAVVLAGLVGDLLADWMGIANLIAAVTLIVVGALAIRAFVSPSTDPRHRDGIHDLSDSEARSGWRTFAVFLRAALLHPVTLVFYFALTLSLGAGFDSWGAGVAFIFGVVVASASWHLMLAWIGSRRRELLSRRARLVLLVIDCCIVLGFVAVILTQPATA